MTATAPARAALFLLDKPPGPTSHDLVALVRRLTGIKRVGHGGTLDPLASGLLPVFVGTATRLIEYLTEQDKCYEADLRLGIQTDTDDAEGVPVHEAPVPDLTLAEVDAALAPFRGEIQQVPPTFSAIKVGGVTAHRAARRGEPLEMTARTVTIHELAALHYTPPLVHIRMRCGSGTYVRAVARDLGRALGCGAHVVAMRRTAINGVSADQAVAPAALEAAFAEGRGWDLGAPLDTFLRHWPHVTLNPEQRALIAHGRSLPFYAVTGVPAHVLAVNPQGWPVAVLEPDAQTPGLWKPAKVLRGSA